ncbi:hypothetical protein F4827_005577 [Paraburkholderia bannensis]|uniref:Uncharacterized protein n=1 Tax=Paraburkholderia bannensis TaxID=765414 RepID=A0A7W9U290_9BURK|nr:hypothetical protein [Paraburkholderia sp. WP4_3_2]MBB6105707.1 hypothetical protein [Paraburkholderia bannensis]
MSSEPLFAFYASTGDTCRHCHAAPG